MIITALDPAVPDWLKNNIKLKCNCGAFILNNEELTLRWCANPYCTQHMAARIVWLCNKFKVQGIGFTTAERLCRQYEYKNALEFLPSFVGKPEVNLWEVGECSFIYGIKSKWEDVLKNANSIAEFYETHNVSPDLLEVKDYLLYCESFFTVKKVHFNQRIINVMASGSYNGYTNRNDLFEELNEKYADYIHIRDVGKKISGTRFLVKEPWANDHSKTNIANENGIPIVSSERFKTIIEDIVAYINKKGE